MNRNPFCAMACGALALLTLAGCQRPFERVSTSDPENIARNVSADTPAARAPASPNAPPPVRPSTPSRETISDAVIAAKIGAELMADEGMRGADVSVNAEHGVVVLAGNVKSYEQAGIASAYAQREDGVMRVDNQLTLAPR
jgi:osmotically-inducible protein OsmY